MNRILILLGISLIIFGCQKKEIFVAQTYQEPEDPSPSETENWSAVSKGLQASVASTNIRFVKSIIPKIQQKNTAMGYLLMDEGSGNHLGKKLLRTCCMPSTADTLLEGFMRVLKGSGLDMLNALFVAPE